MLQAIHSNELRWQKSAWKHRWDMRGYTFAVVPWEARMKKPRKVTRDTIIVSRPLLCLAYYTEMLRDNFWHVTIMVVLWIRIHRCENVGVVKLIVLPDCFKQFNTWKNAAHSICLRHNLSDVIFLLHVYSSSQRVHLTGQCGVRSYLLQQLNEGTHCNN